jgi:hypothetical protein
MHLCRVVDNGCTTLQVPPLCGERSGSAAGRAADRPLQPVVELNPPSADSERSHLDGRLRAHNE